MVAQAAVEAKDLSVADVRADVDSDGRDMRVVELIVAGVALLATVLLSLPK